LKYDLQRAQFCPEYQKAKKGLARPRSDFEISKLLYSYDIIL
jgi:hypothetical protein